MDWEPDFRRARRAPLLSPEERPNGLRVGRERLHDILPHRDPLLLLDAITGVDLDSGHIVGVRHLDPSDPVFTGHFPTVPVYPASLQLEMAGQLALCLHHFLARGAVEPYGPDVASAPVAPIVVTGVLRASFLAPVKPGVTATVLARMLYLDELLGAALVQTLCGERVCSAAVLEVAFP
jgi:3-hydroxymyristoyl/3-hydroxydecanoyl-(acyl carrier protein) dehydratase